MPLAPLFALLLMAGDPPPADPVVTTAPTASSASANTEAEAAPQTASDDDIPPGAPHDDYGLVAWCYGALGEYLTIYDDIKPDLKAIDKMFGSPVVEAEPYSEDMAEARKAEKRFAAAMEAAEKASPQPIAQHGAESVERGRAIWSVVQMKTRRNLVDAWLFWGVPSRCETTSKALKTRATLFGQAFAISPPTVDAPAKPASAPSAAPVSAPPAPAADKPDPAAVGDGPAPTAPTKPG
jgi:hypothetical protein